MARRRRRGSGRHARPRAADPRSRRPISHPPPRTSPLAGPRRSAPARLPSTRPAPWRHAAATLRELTLTQSRAWAARAGALAHAATPLAAPTQACLFAAALACGGVGLLQTLVLHAPAAMSGALAAVASVAALAGLARHVPRPGRPRSLRASALLAAMAWTAAGLAQWVTEGIRELLAGAFVWPAPLTQTLVLTPVLVAAAVAGAYTLRALGDVIGTGIGRCLSGAQAACLVFLGAAGGTTAGLRAMLPGTLLAAAGCLGAAGLCALGGRRGWPGPAHAAVSAPRWLVASCLLLGAGSTVLAPSAGRSPLHAALLVLALLALVLYATVRASRAGSPLPGIMAVGLGAVLWRTSPGLDVPPGRCPDAGPRRTWSTLLRDRSSVAIRACGGQAGEGPDIRNLDLSGLVCDTVLIESCTCAAEDPWQTAIRTLLVRRAQRAVRHGGRLVVQIDGSSAPWSILTRQLRGPVFLLEGELAGRPFTALAMGEDMPEWIGYQWLDGDARIRVTPLPLALERIPGGGLAATGQPGARSP